MSGILVTGRDAAALRSRVDSILGETLPWVASGEPAIAETDVWFCAGQPPGELLSLPRLRWIQSGWAGVEAWMDRPEWGEGVLLTRTVGDFPRRIAEYVFGYLLAQTLEIPRALRTMEARGWDHWTPGTLDGRGLLVVGYGAIGREVGSLGRALGMLVTGIRRGPVSETEKAAGTRDPRDLNEALARADFVVNVLPLTRDTESFWNAPRFARMREGATFVNVSRGATVDEGALLEGIRRGRPARAILDVFREEPLSPSHPFREEPAIWVTPHIAGIGAIEPLAREFAENWRRYQAGGALRSVVDRERGY